MQIENTFDVAAPPDRVFAFLLDVNRVVGCMPGAELSEIVDPTTFKGKVKIKVGPVTVAYAGTARIAERDEAARTATLEGDGRETTGPGSARARAQMTVEDVDGASRVTFATDFTVAGRVAQFGRGLMEDVSRKLIGQMAECIKSQLEVPIETGEAVLAGTEIPPRSTPIPTAQPTPPTAKPVNALALLWSVLMVRLKGLFTRKR